MCNLISFLEIVNIHQFDNQPFNHLDEKKDFLNLRLVNQDLSKKVTQFFLKNSEQILQRLLPSPVVNNRIFEVQQSNQLNIAILFLKTFFDKPDSSVTLSLWFFDLFDLQMFHVLENIQSLSLQFPWIPLDDKFVNFLSSICKSFPNITTLTLIPTWEGVEYDPAIHNVLVNQIENAENSIFNSFKKLETLWLSVTNTPSISWTIKQSETSDKIDRVIMKPEKCETTSVQPFVENSNSVIKIFSQCTEGDIDLNETLKQKLIDCPHSSSKEIHFFLHNATDLLFINEHLSTCTAIEIVHIDFPSDRKHEFDSREWLDHSIEKYIQQQYDLLFDLVQKFPKSKEFNFEVNFPDEITDLLTPIDHPSLFEFYLSCFSTFLLETLIIFPKSQISIKFNKQMKVTESNSLYVIERLKERINFLSFANVKFE